MIYSKVEHSLKEFDYIAKNKINLFKIHESWEQFIKSKSYSLVCELIEKNLEKVNYSKYRLNKKIDKKMMKETERTSSDSFGSILSQAKSSYEMSNYRNETNRILKLFKDIIKKSTDETELTNAIKFVEALLFYLHH